MFAKKPQMKMKSISPGMQAIADALKSKVSSNSSNSKKKPNFMFGNKKKEMMK